MRCRSRGGCPPFAPRSRTAPASGPLGTAGSHGHHSLPGTRLSTRFPDLPHHCVAAATPVTGPSTNTGDGPAAKVKRPSAGCPTERRPQESTSVTAACRRLIGSGARFDAVFCGNDQIALGAESVLRESGRRVPDDVALDGVDNWEYVIGGRSARRLTTVDTGLAALGAAAAAQVADGRDAPGTHAHPCTLVVGATTSGPRPEG
ncbi:substrate-binding domain-containing protein [Streptomyces sp. NPDC056255]|uniref:substrate-binding domain-containing protein n=1 Tax=Streptomyces sp. NPDC056255 TaxID=3345764 RepID=UPI0035DB0A0C